jgi:hypothetical protein
MADLLLIVKKSGHMRRLKRFLGDCLKRWTHSCQASGRIFKTSPDRLKMWLLSAGNIWWIYSGGIAGVRVFFNPPDLALLKGLQIVVY